jgi:hypothetical protein
MKLNTIPRFFTLVVEVVSYIPFVRQVCFSDNVCDIRRMHTFRSCQCTRLSFVFPYYLLAYVRILFELVMATTVRIKNTFPNHF